jgi:hypothetical protein
MREEGKDRRGQGEKRARRKEVKKKRKQGQKRARREEASRQVLYWRGWRCREGGQNEGKAKRGQLETGQGDKDTNT